MAITIKEIAQMAGVSRGTVDRALNDRGRVAPEVKKKILDIANTYGYKKNIVASRLAKKEISAIAVVMPHYAHDPFWKAPYEGIHTLQKSMADFGMHIVYYFFDLSKVDTYTKALDQAIRNMPDAILLAPVFKKESIHLLQVARHNAIPIVTFNSQLAGKWKIPYIGQDSFITGKIAGRLIGKPIHERNEILVINLGHSSKNATHIKRKIDGIKSYYAEANLEINITTFDEEDYAHPAAIEVLVDHVIQKKDELSGIYFTNSRAYLLLAPLLQKYPLALENIKVVGHDLILENIQFLQSEKIDFLLHQNPIEQGTQAIIHIFNHLAHKTKLPDYIHLPTDIIIKENVELYLSQKKKNTRLI